MIEAMRTPVQMFKEVVAYRELLYALTYRDVSVKYKQAIFGMLWAFLMPLLGIMAGVLVQGAMAYMTGQSLDMKRVGSVMVRILPWTMFIGVFGSVANGILSGMTLASKIYFPRQILALSAMFGALFDVLISTAAVGVLLVVVPGSPLVWGWPMLWAVVFWLILLGMAMGLGMICGSANVFFRDVKYVVTVLLQFGVFTVPVYFFLEQLPGRVQKVMLWNPVSPLLEGIVQAVLHGGVQAELWPWLGYSAVVSAVLVLTGAVVFRRSEHLFAEVM